MADNSNLIRNIYNAFDPFRALPAGDPVYVDCQAVRGDGNILIDVGKKIEMSKRMTYQLYSGHRGAGKSTELQRLKQHLDSKGCFVIYFAADEEDINPEDTEYTDILLACTRHLIEELKNANPKPLLDWLKSRWNDLKDLALTEISFEDLKVDGQITQYAKLTASVRTEPTLRKKIRDKVNPHTQTLIQALNEFINDAKKHLDSGCQLILIADNLDRIVPVPQEDGRNSHDEIFLDRSEQLKALNCHIVYSLPISMMYSSRANELASIYDDTQILPMIMVKTREGNNYEPGLDKLKELIAKRVRQFSPNISLETELFDSQETLNRLCLMSGGHVRNLLQLMQAALERTDTLPIPAKAVQRAITEMRDTYRRTVEKDQWSILAKVSKSQQIENEDECRSLLFNRCLLEYQYFDEQEEKQPWYDVHPLIKDIQQFKDSLAEI